MITNTASCRDCETIRQAALSIAEHDKPLLASDPVWFAAPTEWMPATVQAHIPHLPGPAYDIVLERRLGRSQRAGMPTIRAHACQLQQRQTTVPPDVSAHDRHVMAPPDMQYQPGLEVVPHEATATGGHISRKQSLQSSLHKEPPEDVLVHTEASALVSSEPAVNPPAAGPALPNTMETGAHPAGAPVGGNHPDSSVDLLPAANEPVATPMPGTHQDDVREARSSGLHTALFANHVRSALQQGDDVWVTFSGQWSAGKVSRCIPEGEYAVSVGDSELTVPRELIRPVVVDIVVGGLESATGSFSDDSLAASLLQNDTSTTLSQGAQAWVQVESWSSAQVISVETSVTASQRQKSVIMVKRGELQQCVPRVQLLRIPDDLVDDSDQDASGRVIAGSEDTPLDGKFAAIIRARNLGDELHSGDRVLVHTKDWMPCTIQAVNSEQQEPLYSVEVAQHGELQVRRLQLRPRGASLAPPPPATVPVAQVLDRITLTPDQLPVEALKIALMVNDVDSKLKKGQTAWGRHGATWHPVTVKAEQRKGYKVALGKKTLLLPRHDLRVVEDGILTGRIGPASTLDDLDAGSLAASLLHNDLESGLKTGDRVWIQLHVWTPALVQAVVAGTATSHSQGFLYRVEAAGTVVVVPRCQVWLPAQSDPEGGAEPAWDTVVAATAAAAPAGSFVKTLTHDSGPSLQSAGTRVVVLTQDWVLGHVAAVASNGVDYTASPLSSSARYTLGRRQLRPEATHSSETQAAAASPAQSKAPLSRRLIPQWMKRSRSPAPSPPPPVVPDTGTQAPPDASSTLLPSAGTQLQAQAATIPAASFPVAESLSFTTGRNARFSFVHSHAASAQTPAEDIEWLSEQRQPDSFDTTSGASAKASAIAEGVEDQGTALRAPVLSSAGERLQLAPVSHLFAIRVSAHNGRTTVGPSQLCTTVTAVQGQQSDCITLSSPDSVFVNWTPEDACCVLVVELLMSLGSQSAECWDIRDSVCIGWSALAPFSALSVQGATVDRQARFEAMAMGPGTTPTGVPMLSCRDMVSAALLHHKMIAYPAVQLAHVSQLMDPKGRSPVLHAAVSLLPGPAASATSAPQLHVLTPKPTADIAPSAEPQVCRVFARAEHKVRQPCCAAVA